MVAELEYLRAILAFTVEAADGTELLHVEREEAGTLVTPPVRAALAAIRDERRRRARAGPGHQQARHHGAGPRGRRPRLRLAGVGAGHRRRTPRHRVRDRQLANGIVTVEVDPTDGTFAVDGHGGLGALVDGGDVGDTYNWCPPDVEQIVDAPTAVTIARPGGRTGPGPDSRSLRTYDLPTHVEGPTRAGSQVVEVRTVLELHAGDDLVRVQRQLRQPRPARPPPARPPARCPDRPLASRAECAFAIVERGLTAEGGPTEQALATYPSRRFVTAGGLTVRPRGPARVRARRSTVTTEPRTLAVTLLRCTGMLSQGPMATRPLPAGPADAHGGPAVRRAGPRPGSPSTSAIATPTRSSTMPSSRCS